MKKIIILSVAFLVVSQMVSVPVRSVSNNHGATGIQVMPSTVQMPVMIQQPMNQVNVMQAQPMVAQQLVPAQQSAQSGVVSDQMFLQNTMNKLLGDKLKIMRDKVEKYKKIIQQNASVLEQKVKAFFA